MNLPIRLAGALFTSMALLTATSAVAQVPVNYPADYPKLVGAAEKEGKLIIYSATDSKAVEPLLRDFRVMYPKITVEYHDMNTTEIYNRYISEMAAGGRSADVLWSPAMDLQFKLVKDGYALSYPSPERSSLPNWAVWQQQAYGTTFEPAVFVYNKRLLNTNEVPKTHADLARILTGQSDKFNHKLTTYDIEKSGIGFLFITRDQLYHPGFNDMLKAFGRVGVRVQSSTGTMLERLSSGENLLAYNVLGAYALARAAKDPSIGVQLPSDYTLVFSRVLFISKTAKNASAAKLWLDYVLSRRGQTLIANQAQLFAIRDDVDGSNSAGYLKRQLGSALRPIELGPELLDYLEPKKRLALLRQWKDGTSSRK